MTLQVEAPEKDLNSESKGSPNGVVHLQTKNNETKWTGEFKTYIKETWELKSKITVEPFIFCYVMSSVLTGLAVQTMSVHKACLLNLHYSNNTCADLMAGKVEHHKEDNENITHMVAKLTAWSFPVQTSVPAILALFFGAWSDRTGNRKPFMMLPMLGKFISALGLVMATIFFYEVGLNETALIEGLPPALSGGRVAVTMASYSYVTDITSESERTYRLGILTATFTLTKPFGLAMSGYMVHSLGYNAVFSVGCVLYFIGFFYGVLRIKANTKEVVKSEKDQTCLSIFSTEALVSTVNVALQKRKYSRRLQLFLLLLAYVLIVGPVLGEAQFSYWFARHKFGFTEVDYSLFMTYSILIGMLGSFVTIYVLSKKYKIDDSIIAVIASISRISGSLVYALAPTRTIFYLGPLLDAFSSAGTASLRSIASKLVDSDEIGKTSSLISIAEALVAAIYSPIYYKVMKLTTSTMPGAFYLISASLPVPAMAILIVLYYLRKKETALRDEAETDAKSKEDEITSF